MKRHTLFSRGRLSSGPTTRRPRSTRARWLAVATLALPMAILFAPPASAADGPYNIDGTVPDAGTTELADAFGNVKELGPVNSNTTKIGVIHSDALPTLDFTNPNANVDLRRAWLDTERDTSTGQTGSTSRGSATRTTAAASSPTSS